MILEFPREDDQGMLFEFNNLLMWPRVAIAQFVVDTVSTDGLGYDRHAIAVPNLAWLR